MIRDIVSEDQQASCALMKDQNTPAIGPRHRTSEAQALTVGDTLNLRVIGADIARFFLIMSVPASTTTAESFARLRRQRAHAFVDGYQESAMGNRSRGQCARLDFADGPSVLIVLL
jgi:hypothetical protein